MLPLFDYCDNVWPWSVCIKQDSHRLETLLNFACRTVLRKCRNYSASSARKELGISTLSARQKYTYPKLFISAYLYNHLPLCNIRDNCDIFGNDNRIVSDF
jgi:hypothetical protein